MLRPKYEIREELLNNLAIKIGINTQEEGSIAVAIVDTILEEIYGLYEEMEIMKNQAYLSTSNGVFTELISKLVDVSRNVGENDDSLKLRTISAVSRQAKGNRIAIEEAALAVAGVASIDYRPYALGTGSFVLYVYPQANVNQVKLLDKVNAAVGAVVSEGVYYEIRKPSEVPVDISLILQFEEKVSAMERQRLRNAAKQEVQIYLSNLKKDEVFYLNECISRVMALNEKIIDIGIGSIKVNGVGRAIANIFPLADERFITGIVMVG